MQVFINESSLNVQYEHKYEYIEAIRIFIKSIERIELYKKEKEVFRSKYFYNSTGLNGTYLESVLKSDPSLNELFFANLQKINPKKWQDSQSQDPNSLYEFNNDDYSNTSIAELAERKIQNKTLVGLLLNFEKSVFGNSPQIEIDKDKKEKILVDCAVDDSDVSEWLINNKLFDPNEEYDEKSSLSPLDCQTVLNEVTKFEKTVHRNKGRKAYRRIGKAELWAVDNSRRHATDKAHIEVFDEKTGKHLGTSLYNKIEIDVSFVDTARKIKLS